MRNVGNEGGCACVEIGGVGEMFLSSPEFCHELKTEIGRAHV